jgi:hypothetical protein
VTPFLVFPVLTALAGNYIFGTLLNTGLAEFISSSCTPEKSLAQQLTCTGIPAIDSMLCGFVAFFHTAMEPSALPLTNAVLFNVSCVPVFLFIEASRQGRSGLLSSTVATVIMLLCQLGTGGVVLPLYWLAFITVDQAIKPGKVDQAHAEATFFAFIAGYFIPTSVMIYLKDPFVTLLWQAFPLWMLIAQRFHLLLRSPSKAPQPGTRTIQGLYLFICAIAAVSHLTIVWPNRADWNALAEALLPQVHAKGVAIPYELAAKAFLQWDGVFIYLSSMVAALWFARDIVEMLVLVSWFITAGTTMGPGAALAAVYAWREDMLNRL